MRRLIPCLAAGVLCLTAFGCAGVYTNIEKAPDGSYTVTKVRQGPWRVQGELLRCEGAGTRMTCTRIAAE